YAPIYTKPSLTNRQTLWNAVEKAERRKDATLAREFEIAFPHELNQRQREQLLDELCSQIVNRHSVVVDAVIHAPHTRGGSDERNYHAHIMFTSRHIDQDTGGFSSKKNREFNKEQSAETIKQWRSDFADLCNKYLEQANSLERVDHRSNADRGIDLEATWHEGVAVTAMK
ncbi:MobA/MobL family protein, partial [Acinetobacter bohemicus]|uniref:MobA/MobL family protein n=2 Tax=Acinetobacter TaxID=469 RepID=UPI0021D452B1